MPTYSNNLIQLHGRLSASIEHNIAAAGTIAIPGTPPGTVAIGRIAEIRTCAEVEAGTDIGVEAEAGG